MSRFALHFVAAATLAAAVLAAPASAGPRPPISQPRVTPIGEAAPAAGQHITMRVDPSTLTADEAVSVVADTLESLGVASRLGGLVIEPDAHTVNLFWKGAVPSEIADYVPTASQLGVRVVVHPTARYTRTEEQAAVNRVLTDPALVGAGIAMGAARPQGDGILLRYAESAPDAAGRQAVAAVAGLPVSDIAFEQGAGFVHPVATRQDDSAPWQGGARLLFGSTACSSGFAALSAGAGRLLTAEHCDPGGNRDVASGSGTSIAPASATVTNAGIDSLSIDPTASPATIARIYVGHWSTDGYAWVKNWGANFVGNWVCGSGATTGTHCGVVTNDQATYPGRVGSWYVVAHSDGGAIVGGGDSGGPVYASVSGGVQARGIINAGLAPTACGSHNPDVSPRCYADLLYTPISVTLNTWGYSLEVG